MNDAPDPVMYERQGLGAPFPENLEPASRTVLLYIGLCAAIIGAIALGVYLFALFLRFGR
jgi:hypothetical protein